ncbi:MAG: META domain-containing protein [Prolixibacteraceae bacterium]
MKTTGAPTNKSYLQNVSQITENKWKLESLKGFSENQLKQSPLPPSMEFDTENQRISGFAGCNNYFGNFKITDQGKINISNLASTKKMCINSMELEEAYLKTLKNSEWILVDGETLDLKDKEETVIASFVLQ